MPEDMQGLETWNDALTSLQLLQIDPSGFGGIWLRAPFGPVRERWLRHLLAAGLNTVKVPGSVDMERLLGGIDLSLTLQTGNTPAQLGWSLTEATALNDAGHLLGYGTRNAASAYWIIYPTNVE